MINCSVSYTHIPTQISLLHEPKTRTPIYVRLNLNSEIFALDLTTTPPATVKSRIDRGETEYRWGRSFIYFRSWNLASDRRHELNREEDICLIN